MKKIIKDFCHRGLIFGGFGPIILGIIYMIIEKTTPDFSLTATQIFVAIISVYMIAFIQAGATVFNQIEHWSIPKSTFCHFSMLYLVYVISYLVNSWIPFNINVILIFTGIFVAVYFAVWITVVLTIRLTTRKLNKKI
ncbi:MAG: DUF3021 domain-containing protein [Clostridia bacterium]|nr:DUF3021 domain-containing protein [Clostridia bacterium]